MYTLKSFDVKAFLTNYWQKKPCVFRNILNGFDDPLDENDLAGLAMEEEIDSRIISNQQERWKIFQGPFSDFDAPCQGKWTLLAQGVERYIPEGKQLMDAFDFIPKWRKDDLMVSFSVPGAGVGPHIDQYDVFIIQGKGQRRWKVGEARQYQEVFPAKGLRQIEGFAPIIDEILNPGDVIYIPPGFPHDGVAQTECLNYSIGFRAPSQAELISDFADHALQTPSFSKRYGDEQLQVRENPTDITLSEIEDFRQLMKESLDSADFPNWLGQYLSKTTDHIAEEVNQLDEQFTEQQIARMLEQGTCFSPSPDFNPVVIQKAVGQSEGVRFFIQGEPFCYEEKHRKSIETLLNSDYWPGKDHFNSVNSLFFVQLLTKLVNAGYWYPA